MNIDSFRSYGNEEIKLCEHISIFGRIDKTGKEGCEYIEELKIECKICQIKHIVEELIN